MEEETKECPSCHVANPITRVTCQVCHQKLLGLNPFVPNQAISGPATEQVKIGKKKRGRKPKVVRERKPRTPKVSKPVEEPEIKPTKEPTVKRRHRKPKSLPIQYFALAGNVLVPISISIQMKPMRKKAIENVGQKLMSLWNRNKSFIS